jgi:hypothetical protein
MKTKIFAPLVVLMTVFTLVVGIFTAPSAQASTQVSNCWDAPSPFGWKAKLCLYVNFRRDADGKGGWVDAVLIDAEGPNVNDLFESKIEDCDNLRLWNSGDVVKWRKDDAECDLYESTKSKVWYPGGAAGLHLDNSASLNFGWSFYPKIDNFSNPGYTHIAIKIDVS